MSDFTPDKVQERFDHIVEVYKKGETESMSNSEIMTEQEELAKIKEARMLLMLYGYLNKNEVTEVERLCFKASTIANEIEILHRLFRNRKLLKIVTKKQSGEATK